nr:hypothetical protein Itr_chr04CG04410 [Ipomoea trifida]
MGIGAPLAFFFLPFSIIFSSFPSITTASLCCLLTSSPSNEILWEFEKQANKDEKKAIIQFIRLVSFYTTL